MYRKLVTETLAEAISELTASRDLKAMVDAELLESVGQGRGRYSLPTAAVIDLRSRVRQSRQALDGRPVRTGTGETRTAAVLTAQRRLEAGLILWLADGTAPAGRATHPAGASGAPPGRGAHEWLLPKRAVNYSRLQAGSCP
jgi:hypothetical protein